MKVRLQKILASAGIASRRQAESMIAAGDVTVNGTQATLGQSADPVTDSILVRGRPLTEQRHVYFALNKPAGIVTTMRATHGERTIEEFAPAHVRTFPVGRLDRETSGLLLLTNDGDWADLVTHPRYGVEKEYVARASGHPSTEALDRLRGGLLLRDGTTTSPAEVRVISVGRETTLLRIVVAEGKKRQIRLMLAAVGHPVISLERVRVGPIQLGDLAPGQRRELTTNEVESIRESAARPHTVSRRGVAAPDSGRRTGRRR